MRGLFGGLSGLSLSLTHSLTLFMSLGNAGGTTADKVESTRELSITTWNVAAINNVRIAARTGGSLGLVLTLCMMIRFPDRMSLNVRHGLCHWMPVV